MKTGSRDSKCDWLYFELVTQQISAERVLRGTLYTFIGRYDVTRVKVSLYLSNTDAFGDPIFSIFFHFFFDVKLGVQSYIGDPAHSRSSKRGYVKSLSMDTQ